MSETSAPELTAEEHKARWRALAVCLVAGAMTLLDVSIVNVALPSIREGLDAGASTIQWVVAGYGLAFGVLLVPSGRLGDARSRRAVFIAGVALFTVASAACGLATGPVWLATARVVQGFGGGLISPQVSGFIQNLFQGKERARAFGLFGATVGISTAIGPVLGGLLVQIGGAADGWRLVFFVNVPIGIGLIALALRYLPSAEEGRRQSLDPGGVVLFAAAMLFVLLPVVTGKQGAPIGERPWWLLGFAALFLALFAGWERSWRRRGKETVVEPALLRLRSYVLALGIGTFYFAGFTSVFIIVTLYLQVGLGYSALQAGAAQVPFAVGSAIAALLGGRLVSRFGRSLVVGGLLLVAGGLIGLDLVVPHLDGDAALKIAPMLFVAGFGGGFVITPNITLALQEVEPAQSGVGGGLLQTVQRSGSAIGVAIVLALYFEEVATTRGDHAAALSYALHTTIGFVAVALLLGLADLARRTHGERSAKAASNGPPRG